MAKDKAAKAPKAGKVGKAPKEPKAGKGLEGPEVEKVKGPRVKGALMDKVTNLVLVLFLASLVAQQVTALTG